MSEALDPQVLASLRQLSVDGEADVLTEVLQVFLADAPGRLAAIERAAAQGDALALQRAAHALKGAAAAIGAFRLQAACRALEELAKAGTVPASADVAAVRDELAQARAAITDIPGIVP